MSVREGGGRLWLLGHRLVMRYTGTCTTAWRRVAQGPGRCRDGVNVQPDFLINQEAFELVLGETEEGMNSIAYLTPRHGGPYCGTYQVC